VHDVEVADSTPDRVDPSTMSDREQPSTKALLISLESVDRPSDVEPHLTGDLLGGEDSFGPEISHEWRLMSSPQLGERSIVTVPGARENTLGDPVRSRGIRCLRHQVHIISCPLGGTDGKDPKSRRS
jgi:hypothetical protein